jgi:hypothetical protein
MSLIRTAALISTLLVSINANAQGIVNTAILHQVYGSSNYSSTYNRGHDYYETGAGGWASHIQLGDGGSMPAYNAGRGTEPLAVINDQSAYSPTPVAHTRQQEPRQQVYEERKVWNASTRTWVKTLIRVQ